MDFVTRQAPLSMGILQARILEWVAPLLQGIVKANGPAGLYREQEENLGYWGAVGKGCREVGKAVRAVGKGWSFTTLMPVS